MTNPLPRDEVFAISLGVRHEALELRRMLESWGCVVSRSWVAGETRAAPNGRIIGGTWPNSFASARLEVPEDSRLASSLAHALDTVSAHRDDIAAFVDKGGHAALFVGWGFENTGGARLDWELLARLAEFRIALDLDIYPREPSELEDATHGQA